MKNMLKLAVISPYLVCQVASAQVIVTPLQPQAEGEIFPVVRVVNQPNVSKKINTLLQLEHLKHLPNSYKKHPFEKVRFNEKNCCGSVTFAEWTHFKTPNNIVSISLTGDSTGAYTESFDVYENFDKRTGNKVLSNALIKPSKKTALGQLLVDKVRKRIKAHLHDLRKNKAVDSLNAETYAEQTALYQECLVSLKDVTFDWFRFYVKKNSVIFIKGRCSNHAMRALDDIGTFYIEMPIKNLQPYLSDYGKNVLSSSSKLIKYNDLTGKLLKGKLGKTGIHFVLKETNEDNSIDALYWYNKYKQPIELDGSFKDNTLIAYENNYDDKKQKWIKRATIRAKWKNGKLTGTWQDAKTNTVYALTLTH